jgi:hypothetical protein
MLYKLVDCHKALEDIGVYITIPTLTKYLKKDLFIFNDNLQTYYIRQNKFHEYFLFFKNNDYRNYFLLNYLGLEKTKIFLKRYTKLSLIMKGRNVSYFISKHSLKSVIKIAGRTYVSNFELKNISKGVV